jgi:hypothetical protein
MGKFSISAKYYIILTSLLLHNAKTDIQEESNNDGITVG